MWQKEGSMRADPIRYNDSEVKGVCEDCGHAVDEDGDAIGGWCYGEEKCEVCGHMFCDD